MYVYQYVGLQTQHWQRACGEVGVGVRVCKGMGVAACVLAYAKISYEMCCEI